MLQISKMTNRQPLSIELHEGENLILSLKPHPLTFVDFYGIFFYLVAIAIFFIRLHSWIKSLPNYAVIGWIYEPVFIIFWIICTILPFLIIAILRIVWRWLFFSLLLVLTGLTVKFWLNLPTDYMQLPLLLGGILGLSLTELYRRGHNYYISNQRIITELRFISYKKRELTYGKISDLAISKSFLGRLFNYATIFPITASGFGLGEDLAAVTVGGGLTWRGTVSGVAITGGRTVNVPRGRSFSTLFGISNPERVCNIISSYVYTYEGAPYLKKISEDVEKLSKRN